MVVKEQRHQKLKELGLKIKIERVKRGLTQSQLAERIGCVSSVISSWERGEKCPSYLAIKELEAFFGIVF